MIGWARACEGGRDFNSPEGRGVEQTTGRPEGWTGVGASSCWHLPLAVLPVLIEYSFLDGFLAEQNKS